VASGFFALLDDISMLMDSTSAAAKTAAKNTAGVLGDDLAVNASKASQFKASRELPVLWAITKGSLLNKVIIVPIILALSFYFPQAIVPILLFGGVFLSYEGAHSIWGYIFPHEEHSSQKNLSEKEKIKSAIITDFVLSIEIVLIALASVQNISLTGKILLVSLIAIGATIGVYGLVALLVRLDDIGLALAKKQPQKSFKYKFGMRLVSSLPLIIKTLSIVGVFAMLLVAGGIFMHNIHTLHEIAHTFKIPSFMAEIIFALIVGGFAMLIIDGTKFLIGKPKGTSNNR